MISSEFKKDDYWLLKWPLLSLALSLIISGSLLFGLSAVDTAADAELRRARSRLDEARNAVDKIEEEEATIVEYLGRYRVIEQEGAVAPEDRLQFQETIAELRSQFDLFPVNLNIHGQKALPLQYPDGGSGDGREILLQTSIIDFTLPLLHENDLANLVQSLLAGPGLLQPLACTISANSTDVDSYIYLAQHFDASCSLNWYTFRLPPPEEPDQ